ncbi:PAS domain S-box protein [Myxococcota bacterium]|nr:PAS domain S-box protein [Myxococcota bacterium]
MYAVGQRIAWKTSLLYAAAGMVWIIGSDMGLDALALDPAARQAVSIYKGLAFVGLTTVLLFIALRRQLAAVDRAAAERSAAESALAASERRLRTYVEGAPAGITVTDETGRFTDCNPAAERLLACPRTEIIGRRITDFVAPSEEERALASFADLLTTGRASVTLPLAPHPGRVAWVEVNAAVLDERTTMAFVHDVSARHAAELARRESEDRFQTVVGRLPVGVLVEVDRQIAFANAEARRLFQADGPERLTGLHALDLVHPESRSTARERLVELFDRGRAVAPRESRIVALDGAVVEVDVGGVPVAVDGRPGAIVFLRDLTEHKRLEAQLRQSQKLEAIGTLAGGVAHDFNNLLTVIKSNASLLVDERVEHDETIELAREVLDAADRAAGLTRQLLLFSRRQTLEPRPVDVSAVVGNLAKMLRRVLGETIRLEIESTGLVPPVMADVGMLEQVVVNLVVNARDAMPDGGDLRIRTEWHLVAECVCRDNPKACGDACVMLSVSDTGTGIAPETLPRIFEPFFTTKAQGKGTGLGLATVHGIVEQHHGWITVESEVGRGTTFNICFPPAPRTLLPEPSAVAAAPLPRGDETLLVVEDEEAVRRIVVGVLARCGYTVYEAGDGEAACEVFERHGETISLIVTDLVMPGALDGVALVTRLRARHPSLRALYTSGYSAVADGRVDLVPGDNFLAKPYTAQALAESVRQRLDESPD